MRFGPVLKFVGILSFVIGLTMIVPLLVGLHYGDGSHAALLKSMGITVFAGLALYLMFRSEDMKNIGPREGMGMVAIGWTVVGLFGGLPFYFSGEFHSFVDAFFESVSGFTTTGASVLNNIEAVPKGLLFWRSLIQWLGGMGIIVLSIAILPFLGVGGMQLYKAEVPSPVPDKLTPRVRDTALVLWKVYALITALEIVMLLFGGMSLYDAVSHALTTLPTGGFSPKNTSIAHYDSVYVDAVVIFFMFLAGVNFSLHYQFLRGRTLAFWRDPECRFFSILVLILVGAVTLDILSFYSDNIGKAMRYASFQVVSILTTTGYVTADYGQWPALSQWILVACMIIGASAGSTGGGVKCLRVMLCIKYCYREMFTLIHPRAVKRIKIAGKPVSDEVMQSVMGFLALFIGLFAVCTVLLASIGVDFVTSIGAVAACIGNIGPGLGAVGPVNNFANIPDAGKWLLIWCMLIGRLEVFTVIILLVPEFWRR